MRPSVTREATSKAGLVATLDIWHETLNAVLETKYGTTKNNNAKGGPTEMQEAVAWRRTDPNSED